MNVETLFSLAAAANTRAIIDFRPLVIPTTGLVIRWKWSINSVTGDETGMLTHEVAIPFSALREDRMPTHRSVLHYLRNAANQMARSGGYPDRGSRLFVDLDSRAARCQAIEAENALYAHGILTPEQYVERVQQILRTTEIDK